MPFSSAPTLKPRLYLTKPITAHLPPIFCVLESLLKAPPSNGLSVFFFSFITALMKFTRGQFAIFSQSVVWKSVWVKYFPGDIWFCE